MGTYTTDQRTILFQQIASRTGIHAPLLAALHALQQRPALNDGETGLGVLPTASLPATALGDLAGQAQGAALSLQALNAELVAAGWTSDRLWDTAAGQYAPAWIDRVAQGYRPTHTNRVSGELQPCAGPQLLLVYRQQVALERSRLQVTHLEDANRRIITQVPQLENYFYLDKSLLEFIDRAPVYYQSLPHQREAFLEMVRIWRSLRTQDEAIIALGLSPIDLDPKRLDAALLQFARRISPNYGGYPTQREALLRLVQIWRQLESREATISSLANDSSPEANLRVIDPMLMVFVLRVPEYFTGSGQHRNALVEAVRIWRELSTRNEAVISLGVDPNLLTASTNPQILAANTAQLDRALLDFLDRVPAAYQGRTQERDALIRLVQLWRNLTTRDETIQGLTNDLAAATWTVLSLTQSTLFKTRPIQSSLLPDAEKVPMPAGELSTVQAITENTHYRIIVVEPIRNRREWYAYTGHVDLLQTGTLLIKVATVLKTKPVQASSLPESDKVTIAPGEFGVRGYEDLGDHLRIRLVKPIQDRIEWFVYTGHVAILNLDPYPPPQEPDPPAPTPTPSPTPDRGRRIAIPGIGTVWTNDPIVSGGNFTWGEATKNGTRIPLTQSISFNISNMARRMEEVRRRLGNRPMIVTSWYRPPAVNAAVGGVSNSTHLRGYAVDFIVSGLSARSTQRILDSWWPGGLGYGPNFTHLDNRGYRVRWNYS